MITDFPGLSFQLKIMLWQAAVTIPTERRPLQRREEAPNFLRRPQKSCNSRNIHLQQHEHNAVWFLYSGFNLNTMQQEYFTAGILSSKNTVKHKYYAIWILCSWKDKQPDFFAAWILCSTNTVQHEYFFATHAIFPCSTRNLAPTGVRWGTGYRWKGYKSHTRPKFIQVLCDLHKIGWNMLVTKYYRLVSCLNQSGTFGGTKVFAPRHHSLGVWNIDNLDLF